LVGWLVGWVVGQRDDALLGTTKGSDSGMSIGLEIIGI
jgi:hypothetical protein